MQQTNQSLIFHLASCSKTERISGEEPLVHEQIGNLILIHAMTIHYDIFYIYEAYTIIIFYIVIL